MVLFRTCDVAGVALGIEAEMVASFRRDESLLTYCEPLRDGDSAAFYRWRRNGAIIVAESPTAHSAGTPKEKK